ncbi:P-loop containing nucleoside triphosphate hydrolase protein [Mycena metata]|uniref:P-loop containing nucleoside triphosphate hydrolase protein n=1 Tax=Mycena metata TaxID=1033252 RepID=A0AAD7H8S9_9AGAR|nr:P-loop containing nucleoside triphosphate hydrolase protein [Mycena metata]
MHAYFSHDVGHRHACLLYGLGGSGKTQIALKFIEECNTASRFSNVFFIDASTVDTINIGLKNIAIAQYIGETPEDGLHWLAYRHIEWLLLFDNADDPSINLRNFFPRCAHGNILITSRNPQLRVHAPQAHYRISDMEEEEATHLLLRSAAQGETPENCRLARDIVKALFYLPLAVVQAGAFISKSGALEHYLALYEANCSRLLAEQPTQTQDDYGWTVYTTWKISFDCLSRPATKLLQLSSFLHHEGISEQMFANAASYKFKSSGPTHDEVQEPIEFLAQFLTPSGTWDSLKFLDLTTEIHGYSLIDLEPRSKMYSLHPLVHDWTRSTVENEQSARECIAAIAGMSIPWGVEQGDYLFRQRLLPHLDSVMRRRTSIQTKFSYEYGFIYYEGGRGKEAERLTVSLLKMQKRLLGEEHPSTLTAMGNLASTYCALGSWKEAEELGVIVMERRKQLFGPEHPETLLAMGDLGWTYHLLGRLQEAEELEVVVMEKQKQLLGENHPDTLRAMGHLALTYFDLGRVTQGEALGTLCMEGRKTLLGSEHPETLRTMGNIAMARCVQGLLKEAEDLEAYVLEKRKRVLGEDHPQTLRTMGDLAMVYCK